ncbi:MAG: UvrD-helicase domain-containing protein [Elusimicrobia bacterium]|nr:UvrD-helicase domain-containing protein [Elusimicrobiota bacterium]
MKFTGIKIVEASAGSGKTYALSRAYLGLLLADPTENTLKSLLAITFTNKATYEMKERILELLKRTALDGFVKPEDKKDLLAYLKLQPAPAKDKSLQALDTIILNYNSFQVKTIDSFVNLLLSGCAYRLGLPADFRIKKNFEYYLEAALDLIIERAGQDSQLRAIFEDFLEQYLYAEDNKSWSPRRDILDLAKDMFTQTTKHGMDFRVPEHRNAPTLKLRRTRFLELLRELKGKLPQGTHKTFLKSLDNFLQDNKDTFGLDGMSTFFYKDDLPLNKGVTCEDAIHKLWDQVRVILADIAMLESSRGYDHYLQIYDQIRKAFQAICRKESILFLPELNGQAVKIFSEEDFSIPELYYRLAARYRYILIDEFQDTSLLQWSNLSPLAEEALASGGGLFLVGDAKQAIYRFRGGEASLFTAVPENLSQFGLTTEKLARNFRSGREIVSFVNAIFQSENLQALVNGFLDKKDHALVEDKECGKYLSLYHDLVQSAVKEKDGYVNVTELDGEYPPMGRGAAGFEEATEQAVLARTKELLKRFNPGEIAILARTNKQAELITGWLLEAKLPVESEKTLNILEHNSVREVVSLLEFLTAPLDNLAFATFISGESFTRVSWIPVAEINSFLFQLGLRVRQGDKIYYYREFQKEYKQVWDKLIEDIFRKAGFLPLYELIMSIASRFELLKNDLPTPGLRQAGQGFLVRFLELVKEQEEESLDIPGFLEYLKDAREEDLYVKTRESHSIRVLTVHKAKGLEFPAVIVPFTGIDPKVNNFHIREDEGMLSPLNIAEKYWRLNRKIAEIRRTEYLKSILDEINTLYVSFTRPKEELHIFVEKESPIVSLLPGLPYEKGKMRTAKEEIKAIPPIVLSGSLFEDWTVRLNEEQKQPEDQERKKRQKEGEILHYLLAGIGDTRKQDVKTILRDRRKSLPLVFFTNSELDALEKKALAAVNSSEMKQFFSPDAEVLTEVSITAEGGVGRRIDRLLIFPKEVWVVDYKAARLAPEKDYEQLAGYCRAVETIYGKKSRGFLIYLDKLLWEEHNV